MALPAFLSNVERFATRPMTVQREELGRVMFWKAWRVPFVSLPLSGGTRATYVERDGVRRAYARLAAEMTADRHAWKKHLSDYHAAVREMRESALAASQAAQTPQNEWAKLYAGWVGALDVFAEFVVSPYAVERVLDAECRSLLAQEFEGEAERAFDVIATPSELNDYQKMRLAICDAALAGKVTAKVETVLYAK